MKSTKLLIIGGGCAGLSLARRLAESSASCPTIVIEPRTEYVDDRTWCFWGSQKQGIGDMPLHAWSWIGLSNGKENVRRSVAETPYQMLKSIDFYRDAVNRIAAGSNVELRLGTSAYSTQSSASGGWETETSDGPIWSEFVIDTRPHFYTNADPLLWQSFIGYEIECSLTNFDAETAELMQFLPAGPTSIDFVYVLPTSSTRALIEFTRISTRCAGAGELTRNLLDQIEQLCSGHPYKIIRKEQGSIPMGLPAVPTVPSTLVRVGVTAGSARASSGYTFNRIQRWADACSQALLAGGVPIGPLPDSRLLMFMDAIFLRVLKRQPELGPRLFMAMFRRVPAPRLLRFLTDSPSGIDALWLIACLPKWPFVRACFQSDRPSPERQREPACSP
jgi:lycopene beta-cyclase